MIPKTQKTQKIGTRKKTRLEKITRVNAEIARLNSIFDKVHEKERQAVDGLIAEAANIRVTLEDWRNELDHNGWTEMFRQSDKVEPYEKKRPMAEMYLNLNPNYLKIIDKLISYLPKNEGSKENDDGFDSFTEDRD